MKPPLFWMLDARDEQSVQRCLQQHPRTCTRKRHTVGIRATSATIAIRGARCPADVSVARGQAVHGGTSLDRVNNCASRLNKLFAINHRRVQNCLRTRCTNWQSQQQRRYRHGWSHITSNKPDGMLARPPIEAAKTGAFKRVDNPRSVMSFMMDMSMKISLGR